MTQSSLSSNDHLDTFPITEVTVNAQTKLQMLHRHNALNRLAHALNHLNRVKAL